MSLTKCYQLIDKLNSTESIEQVHAVCAELGDLFGLERFIYGARIPTSFVQPRFIFVTSYPQEWRTRYTDLNYIQIDPTVRHCAENFTPIIWGQAKVPKSGNQAIMNFMDEAQVFGLCSGVSFPVHTPQGEFAMFSLTTEDDFDKSHTRLSKALPFASLFSAYLHERIRDIFGNDVIPLKNIELSAREKECLLWAAEGKTTWETSQILNISERTVVYHIQNSVEKLDVVNRPQAIARAITMGIIVPQLSDSVQKKHFYT